MKKIYYENGPDEIKVGPKNNAILMKRGEPAPLDDRVADALLKKPMFREAKVEGKSKKEEKGWY